MKVGDSIWLKTIPGVWGMVEEVNIKITQISDISITSWRKLNGLP